MKNRVFILASVLFLSGCGATPKDYALMPNSLLCEAAVSTQKMYYYYSDLIAEVNKRGIDCAEAVRNKMKSTTNVIVKDK